MSKDTDHDLWITDPMIIYGSWPVMIHRKVNLGEIGLKGMSGQCFAYAEHKTTKGPFGI